MDFVLASGYFGSHCSYYCCMCLRQQSSARYGGLGAQNSFLRLKQFWSRGYISELSFSIGLKFHMAWLFLSFSRLSLDNIFNKQFAQDYFFLTSASREPNTWQIYPSFSEWHYKGVIVVFFKCLQLRNLVQNCLGGISQVSCLFTCLTREVLTLQIIFQYLCMINNFRRQLMFQTKGASMSFAITHSICVS